MTEEIMGIPVDQLTYEKIMTDVGLAFEQKQQLQLLSVNPQIVLHARDYPEIISLLKKASHRLPDGIGIVKVSQKIGGTITQRITGIELMYQLLTYANQHQRRIFLYGGRPDVLQAAAANIQRDYPHLTLSGSLDGYTELSPSEVTERINTSQAEIVFVALGFPKQELYLASQHQHLKAIILQDVGGSLDVISGTVKRAPDFFIKHHLEWLYRSFSSPKRWKRALELPLFYYKAIQYAKKQKK